MPSKQKKDQTKLILLIIDTLNQAYHRYIMYLWGAYPEMFIPPPTEDTGRKRT